MYDIKCILCYSFTIFYQSFRAKFDADRCLHQSFQNALSGPALLHSLDQEWIKNKTKKNTCLQIIRIDRRVVWNQYVARGSPSVTCEARVDSASGEGFKLNANRDMKENYP